MVVGAGPEPPGVVTVVSVSVVNGPPGRTHEHVLLGGQVVGPVVPDHVVVWPVQVHEAGQVDIVTILVLVVVVMVELPQGVVGYDGGDDIE